MTVTTTGNWLDEVSSTDGWYTYKLKPFGTGYRTSLWTYPIDRAAVDFARTLILLLMQLFPSRCFTESQLVGLGLGVVDTTEMNQAVGELVENGTIEEIGGSLRLYAPLSAA